MPKAVSQRQRSLFSQAQPVSLLSAPAVSLLSGAAGHFSPQRYKKIIERVFENAYFLQKHQKIANLFAYLKKKL